MERGSSSKNILKLPILVANSTNSRFRHNSLIPKFPRQWVVLKMHTPMLNLNFITICLCFEKYLFLYTNNYLYNCVIWWQTTPLLNRHADESSETLDQNTIKSLEMEHIFCLSSILSHVQGKPIPFGTSSPGNLVLPLTL